MNFFSVLNLSFFSHQFIMLICLFISIFVLFILFYLFSSNFNNSFFFTHFYLEFFWTFFPILLVLLLLLPLFLFSNFYPLSFLNIFFLANQWFWDFESAFASDFNFYFTLNSFVSLFLPVGLTFNFIFSAADVLHAFSLPSLFTHADCVPGLISFLEISFPLLGSYTVYCAQICGVNHSQMPFYLSIF